MKLYLLTRGQLIDALAAHAIDREAVKNWTSIDLRAMLAVIAKNCSLCGSEPLEL
jgi:hypothetical protein